jgi:hypothetical protein
MKLNYDMILLLQHILYLLALLATSGRQKYFLFWTLTFRDTVIHSLFQILLQNIYSRMKRIIQGKICNILQKK